MKSKTTWIVLTLVLAMALNVLLVAVCQYLVIFRMPEKVSDQILENQYPQFDKCTVLQQQVDENTMFLMVEDQLGDYHILTFEKMWGLPRYRFIQSNKAWDCLDSNDVAVPFRAYEAQVSTGGDVIKIGVDADMQLWHDGTFSVTARQITDMYVLICPALLAVEAALYALYRKLKK